MVYNIINIYKGSFNFFGGECIALHVNPVDVIKDEITTRLIINKNEDYRTLHLFFKYSDVLLHKFVEMYCLDGNLGFLHGNIIPMNTPFIRGIRAQAGGNIVYNCLWSNKFENDSQNTQLFDFSVDEDCFFLDFINHEGLLFNIEKSLDYLVLHQTKQIVYFRDKNEARESTYYIVSEMKQYCDDYNNPTRTSFYLGTPVYQPSKDILAAYACPDLRFSKNGNLICVRLLFRYNYKNEIYEPFYVDSSNYRYNVKTNEISEVEMEFDGIVLSSKPIKNG